MFICCQEECRFTLCFIFRTPDTLWRRMYPPRPPSENEYVDSTRGKDEGQIEARDDWEKAYSSDDDDDCDRSRSGHLINFDISHQSRPLIGKDIVLFLSFQPLSVSVSNP